MRINRYGESDFKTIAVEETIETLERDDLKWKRMGRQWGFSLFYEVS